MDDLETQLIEKQTVDNGLQIVAFKTDSIFIFDPNNLFTNEVTQYFTTLGFKSKTYKYTKLIHAQSRKSDSDVSFYIGLQSNGNIEINGVVDKI